jgi:hypothetical protein
MFWKWLLWKMANELILSGTKPLDES